jgi:hypothetical protein
MDENPRPLAVEGRPIYKKIDKYERAGDKNCLEPAWKGHWQELRVDMITALTLALLFDALLGETTEVAGTTFGPITLGAFYLGCGLKAGLKAPAQSIVHVRWMTISITNQFLPKGFPRGLFQSKIVKANKPILQFFKFMDNRFFTAERSLTFQVDAQLAFEKRRWDSPSESFSTFFTDFMRLHDKLCEAQRTRKSNKDFVYTTLDIWDRLHISLEYSLADNAVLDTAIENLVAAIHDNGDGITQKMLDDFVEKIVLREPRFRSTGQLPALRAPQARHAQQVHSPAPALQTPTLPMARYVQQQHQLPAAPVHIPNVAQTPVQQHRGQGTTRAAPATGAHGAILAKFDSDNKCQTQHGAVILVTKADGQTRFTFPKEEHAEYWTADKRGAFTECCRRNILSGGVWRLCGSKGHSTAGCTNPLAKATTTNHARRAVLNNPMHPSQGTSPFCSEVEFAKYEKDTGLLGDKYYGAPSLGVPQYLTPVAIFTLAVAVVISSSMPPAIVQYLIPGVCDHILCSGSGCGCLLRSKR